MARLITAGVGIVPIADAWADRRLTLRTRRFADFSVEARLLASEILRQSAQAPAP